ncbi:Protein GrpE [uncultured archaeon]|nr:Protein GrpE [uncultured archaeon]
MKKDDKNNIFRKNLQEYIRFPGILITGIFLFFYSVLRFNHWALIDIMFLSGIGIVIILLGIIMYYHSPAASMTAAGIGLSGIALGIFYLYDRKVTDIIAISYSFGVIMLLLSVISVTKNKTSAIITKTYNLPMQNPGILKMDTVEDRYTKTVSSGLQNLQDIIIGYRDVIAEEKSKIKASVEKQLLDILELNDGFESYINKYKDQEQKPEGFIQIKKMYDFVQETLDNENVHPIEVQIGESIDEKRHEVIKVTNEPPADLSGKPSIVQVRRKGFFINSPVPGKVLRRTRVEVEWKSDNYYKK